MFRSITKLSVSPKMVFQKLGDYPSTWEVERMIDYPDLPEHVRLTEIGGGARTMTIALSILSDPKEWKIMKEGK